VKPKHSPSGNIDGERHPGTTDWSSGQFVDDYDIDQGVVNLNQF
jgi:hypothetical protein